MKKSVTFKNGAWNLAGVMFLPDDFDDNKKILDQIAEQRTAEANGAPVKYVQSRRNFA